MRPDFPVCLGSFRMTPIINYMEYQPAPDVWGICRELYHMNRFRALNGPKIAQIVVCSDVIEIPKAIIWMI